MFTWVEETFNGFRHLYLHKNGEYIDRYIEECDGKYLFCGSHKFMRDAINASTDEEAKTKALELYKQGLENTLSYYEECIKETKNKMQELIDFLGSVNKKECEGCKNK